VLPPHYRVQHYGYATGASLDSGMSLDGYCREEAQMTGSQGGEGRDTMGGPEPDEQGTDLMGGSGT
jgi:hypothetical protein